MHPLVLAVAVFVILFIAAYALISAFGSSRDDTARQRIHKELGQGQDDGEYRPRADVAPLLTRLLRTTRLNELLQWELLRAGLLIKPSEMIVVCLAGGLTTYIVGLLLAHNLAVRVVLLLGGLAGPWLYVIIRKEARYKALMTQLPEALQLVASSLRSGFSILRGIEVVANEMPPPIAQEFQWVLDEVNVGVSMEKAFSHMTTRTASQDVKLMVTAIQIQSKVGGDLAQVLETTSTMIRERLQITAEVAALTAEGRLSALILGGLPVGLGLLIHILNPDYLRPLLAEPLGVGMLVVGGSLMLFGMLIIKQMLNVDV